MADALQAGANFVNSLYNSARKTAQYNALNQQFGPGIAYDPQQAQQAAAADVSMNTIGTQEQQKQAELSNTQAELPIKQAQAKNINVQAQTGQTSLDTDAALRGTKMLGAIAGPDGSIDAASARHVLSNPAYNLTPEQIDATVAKLGTPRQFDSNGKVVSPGGVDTLNDMSQALMSGGKVTGGTTAVMNPDGTTTLYRGTSRGGEVATNIGQSTTAPLAAIPIRQQTANASTSRAASAAQNANTNTYNAGTRANNTPYGAAPGTTLPGYNNRSSANFGGGNTLPAPTVDKIGAGNPPGTVTAPAVPQLSGKPLATRTSQAQMVINANQNYTTANQMLSQLQQQANGYTTGAGSWTDWVRGSAAANLRANAQALRGQVGAAIISSMKNAQGQMGFRMTNAEFNTLTDSLGALGNEQSAAQFKQHLGYVANAIRAFNQSMNGGFKQQFQTDPYSALGINNSNAAPANKAPPPGLNLPPGFKYVGPAP